MTYVVGSHHITLGVAGAQEDAEFHVDTLGMRLIKRTVMFDGVLPIYHLYYANADGDPSSIITTLPFAQAGVYGRRGTDQAREVLIAAPAGSLEFWSKRLTERSIEVESATVFDRRRLLFHHPCGVEYRLVEVDNDVRKGHAGGGVPPEYALYGMYGIGVHVTGADTAVEFAATQLSAKEGLAEGDRFALEVGEPGNGGAVELVINRSDPLGTWTYAAGTIHHFAVNVDTLENQHAMKLDMEGAGFTDISELKDRKYFKSLYVRSPGGAMFELAVTHDDGGWNCDESPRELGSRFQLPEQFEHRREELLGRLEKIDI